MATFKTIRRRAYTTTHYEHVDIPVSDWHDARSEVEIRQLVEAQRADLKGVAFTVLNPIHYLPDGIHARLTIQYVTEE